MTEVTQESLRCSDLRKLHSDASPRIPYAPRPVGRNMTLCKLTLSNIQLREGVPFGHITTIA